ncbi:MAG: nicotinamide mononucleotide transporter [Gammaproteobacteria bacterium]|nr:nicotinamide mononucleotide transporter [Gammaproteobacteria bacterium]
MPASLPEWIAVALALAYVLLAIRQSRWCWPAAATSSAIYLVLFWRGGLPMQAALQAFYIAMAAYGWRAWRASHGQAEELPVGTWRGRRHVIALATVAVAAGVNSRLVTAGNGLLVAYVDAFVAWGSVLATWMVARKVLENWLYWIGLDLLAAALYYGQGFHATAGLFLVYVALAAKGYSEWRADCRRQGTTPAEPVEMTRG